MAREGEAQLWQAYLRGAPLVRRLLTERERLLRSVREEAFTTQVLAELRRQNWLATHFRPTPAIGGRRRRIGAWATPLQGAEGLPDIVAVRPPRVIFAELKREGYGELAGIDTTPMERKWLVRLGLSPGAETYVWTPGMFEEIVLILARGPREELPWVA